MEHRECCSRRPPSRGPYTGPVCRVHYDLARHDDPALRKRCTLAYYHTQAVEGAVRC